MKRGLLVLAAVIALQPAVASAAGWMLVLEDLGVAANGFAIALVAVPGTYPTKPACIAAGKAAKAQLNEGVIFIDFACIPHP